MPNETILRPDDVVAIFPRLFPVEQRNSKSSSKLTEQPLSLDDVAARVSRPDCGAIATFGGVVRGETATTEGPRGTDFLAYEAYAEMAERMLAQIGEEIMAKWPKVQAVSILHRTGRCEVGELSVVIAVATPHRGDGCFEACRYAIERLKAIVPIWKQENWIDGQVWIEGPRQPELDLAAPPTLTDQ
ncbi:MAG: molybdenum cofactor biosynthesis protein MoaE [Caldilineaceae bacterium]